MKTTDNLCRTFTPPIIHNDKMKIALIAASLIVLVGGIGSASSFQPSDAEITQTANRFRAILDTSGISGVGRDVLKCYDDNLEDQSRLKVCDQPPPA